MALDFEPNDGNPRNTMTLAQAEDFVQAVQQATGRLPMRLHPSGWANGQLSGRRGSASAQPVDANSILARCDLWLADYREAARGALRLGAIAAGGSGSMPPTRPRPMPPTARVPRAVAGVSHCDRNLFAGDNEALHRYWGSAAPGLSSSACPQR